MELLFIIATNYAKKSVCLIALRAAWLLLLRTFQMRFYTGLEPATHGK